MKDHFIVHSYYHPFCTPCVHAKARFHEDYAYTAPAITLDDTLTTVLVAEELSTDTSFDTSSFNDSSSFSDSSSSDFSGFGGGGDSGGGGASGDY